MNPETKRRWYVEGEGWEIDSFSIDFRVGGHERSRFRFKGGPPITNDTIFLDIVPERRIVFVYTMTVNGDPISVSLATVEIAPTAAGSRLFFTEHSAFLDGTVKAEGRASGWGQLFDRLGEELQRR